MIYIIVDQSLNIWQRVFQIASLILKILLFFNYIEDLNGSFRCINILNAISQGKK